jgi:predicted DCC family thiol-disulfide oxidoreductase YuxK
MPGRPPPEPSLVLYDADCGFCKWLLAWLLRWDRAARLRPLALQRPEADELLPGLAPDQRAASWHLISPAGVRYSAGAAIPPLFRLLPGGRAAAFAFALSPGLTERGYLCVAAHRSQLSTLVPSRAKQRAGERVRLRERALQTRRTT